MCPNQAHSLHIFTFSRHVHSILEILRLFGSAEKSVFNFFIYVFVRVCVYTKPKLNSRHSSFRFVELQAAIVALISCMSMCVRSEAHGHYVVLFTSIAVRERCLAHLAVIFADDRGRSTRQGHCRARISPSAVMKTLLDR